MSTSQTAFFTTSRGTDPRRCPSLAPSPRLPTTMRLAGSVADRVEKSLRRVPADEPLLDVSHSIRGETGDRLSRAFRAASAP